jgi:hypothetical protein
MGWPSAQHCGLDDTENKEMTIKIIIFINDIKFRIGMKAPNAKTFVTEAELEYLQVPVLGKNSCEQFNF